MQVEIICVGKLKEKFWTDACREYEKRLSRFCKLHMTELKDEAVGDSASDAQTEQAIAREGERIAKLLQPRDFIVSLCVEGKPMTSEGLARKLSDIEQIGAGRLVFIIGGSNGLENAIKTKSDIKLSFSQMTFPHQLMRVILLEQIYRAYKINAGESYHK